MFPPITGGVAVVLLDAPARAQIDRRRSAVLKRSESPTYAPSLQACRNCAQRSECDCFARQAWTALCARYRCRSFIGRLPGHDGVGELAGQMGDGILSRGSLPPTGGEVDRIASTDGPQHFRPLMQGLAALRKVVVPVVDALGTPQLVVQCALGHEGVHAECAQLCPGCPAHVMHREVLDVLSWKALQRHVERVGTNVPEAVLPRLAILHADKAARGEQVRVPAGE